ncbi:MAG: dUTP diphosphatase [Clostridiales bacterium]|nr:dUTP diphosphatase [Clostridiales bacterium]
MELKFKALNPKIGREIPLPQFATPGSAAMDLRACIDRPVTIRAGERTVVPTGLAMALPSADYVALLFARSGLGIRKGVCLSNGVGVIDSDYRGEIGVGLVNLSQEAYTVQPGDRIAQLMVVPVERPTVSLVEDLDDTSRGSGGFGSTGR